MRKIISILLCVVLLLSCSGCYGTHRFINKVEYNHSKIEEGSYRNQKKVEDTCRSMISSYNADVLIWEQYKDSTDKEERSWANQAKVRANRTASTYNNYILENEFLWAGNVPADIAYNLPTLE